MAKNFLAVAVVLAITAILFFSACSKQQTGAGSGTTAEKGFLSGNVNIGPICPVESTPPDPECQPTKETYKAWPIAVWTADKKSKITQIAVAADGTFKLELPAGTYTVDLENQQEVVGQKELPATVTIKAGHTTTLDIDIDTGIR